MNERCKSTNIARGVPIGCSLDRGHMAPHVNEQLSLTWVDSGRMPVDPFVAAIAVRSDADVLIESLKLERIATLGDVRRVLKEHFLAGIECDHLAKTDTPSCSCSRVTFPAYRSVGEAVDGWIVHVMGILEAPEIT